MASQDPAVEPLSASTPPEDMQETMDERYGTSIYSLAIPASAAIRMMHKCLLSGATRLVVRGRDCLTENTKDA